MADEGNHFSSVPLKRSRECIDASMAVENRDGDSLGNILIPDQPKRSRKGPHYEVDHSDPDVHQSMTRDLLSKVDQQETRGNSTEQKISDDDDEDNISLISGCSGVSGHSESAWRDVTGPISWVQRQMTNGVDPRSILTVMMGDKSKDVAAEFDDIDLWKLIIEIISEPPKRKKLSHVNTIDDVITLLKTSRKIIVLTGAGVSVSCGIPDFRSRNGIYARLAVDFPDLPDPQAMFDIHHFRKDPRPFFKFAKEIYPGQFQPSPSHKFIKLIEDHGQLLRNYTQNIDTLEQVAGISNVIQCHGSFATATCMICKHRVDADYVKEDIMNQVIPRCPLCPADSDMSILKPDIVFFGEGLPAEFHSKMAADKDECDLLIVIGSSLKVRPVALIPHSIRPDVPQILINREPLGHLNFDVELLGDCDGIVTHLCRKLEEGWLQLAESSGGRFKEITRDEILTPPPTPPVSETSNSCMSFRTQSEDNSRMSFTTASESGASAMAMQQSTNYSLPHNKQTDTVQNIVTDAQTDTAQNLVIHEQASTSQNKLSDTAINSSIMQQLSPVEQGLLTKAIERWLHLGQGEYTESHKLHYGERLFRVIDIELCKNANAQQIHTVITSIYKTMDTLAETDNLETREVDNDELISREKYCNTLPDSQSMESGAEVKGRDVKGCEFKGHAIDNAELLRAFWQSRGKESLARRLPEKSYLFLEPNRYVFPGAEVFDTETDSDSSESGDSEQLSDTESTGDENARCDDQTLGSIQRSFDQSPTSLDSDNTDNFDSQGCGSEYKEICSSKQFPRLPESIGEKGSFSLLTQHSEIAEDNQML